MADDSELDYLKTYLTYACYAITVKHFSEVKKLSSINDTRRILIFPGEIISVDGKFYKKRYKIKISDTSEAQLMDSFNRLVIGIDRFQKHTYHTTHSTGNSFNVNSEMSDPHGITWDGTYFWVLGRVNKRVYKYNSAGVYQSESFDVSGETTNPMTIFWDGTYFWMNSQAPSQKVYKYNSAGVYQSVSYSISDTGSSSYRYGLGWDGTNYWISTQDYLGKYDSSWTFIEQYQINIAAEKITAGIIWDGDFLWVIENFNQATTYLSKYDLEGNYLNIGFSIESTGNEYGVTWKSPTFHTTLSTTVDKVLEFVRTIYTLEATMVYMELAYGNKAYEQPKTKRWYQEVYLDVEWSTE